LKFSDWYAGDADATCNSCPELKHSSKFAVFSISAGFDFHSGKVLTL